MTTFRVEFEIDGPAFDRGDEEAIADVRISLRQVAELVSTRGMTEGVVVDQNGERVGRFGVES